MSRSEKGLMPAFLKAKHTSLLTVLVLLLLVSSVNVCDGFSTLHHQPHQIKHFSRLQCRVPASVVVQSPSSVLNTVNGHRMSRTTTSSDDGHQGGRRDENKMTGNIKIWSSDFWFGVTHVHNHYLEIVLGYARAVALTRLPAILLFTIGVAHLPSIAEQTRLALVRVLSMFGAISTKLVTYPLFVTHASSYHCLRSCLFLLPRP